MAINTTHRTSASEIMDNFELEGEELKDALDKIATINQLLGGNELTLQGVQNLIDKISKSNEIVIVDVGCGNGDMLRTLAHFGIKNNLKFQLIGIDANNLQSSMRKNYLKIILILGIAVKISLMKNSRH